MPLPGHDRFFSSEFPRRSLGAQNPGQVNARLRRWLPVIFSEAFLRVNTVKELLRESVCFVPSGS